MKRRAAAKLGLADQLVNVDLSAEDLRERLQMNNVAEKLTSRYLETLRKQAH